MPHSPRLLSLTLVAALLSVAACSGTAAPPPIDAPPNTAGRPFAVTPVHAFAEPWAMTFLPDGRLLVTEKRGHLQLYDFTIGKTTEIAGVPAVAYGGQGGLGDVVLHPDFANNKVVYLSYAEPGDGDRRGAAVARARLVLDPAGGGALQDLKVIWRQAPKVSGQGHYGHRIAFDRAGKLWISSSERQKFDPAQDMPATWARSCGSTTMAACRQTIRLPPGARSPVKSGRSATATCWASLSMHRAGCGRTKWVPGAATNST